MRRQDEPDTVVITGAGGFVGSAVMRRLVAQVAAEGVRLPGGSTVGRVAGLLRPGGRPDRLAELAPGPHWSLHPCNITDPDALAACLAELRPAAIVHTAITLETFGPLDRLGLAVHVERPLGQLVGALPKGGRLVSTGTAAVVQPGPAMAEADSLVPSPHYLDYARNKLAEERALGALAPQHGVTALHLRLFYMFGRHEAEGRLLPHVVSGVLRGERVKLTSGEQVRDYTDVDDVAGAYVAAVSAPEGAACEVLHVGTGLGVTVRSLASAAAAAVGGTGTLAFGEIEGQRDELEPVVIADPRRAAKRLGWQAAADTLERVADTARWFRDRMPEPDEQMRSRAP